MKTDTEKTNAAQPPDHLREPTKAWWRQILADFELEPHHVRLLQLACEAWDSTQLARETIAKEGAHYLDRFNAPRAHPAVAMERDSRIAFARILRELGLDSAGTPAATTPRPKPLRY